VKRKKTNLIICQANFGVCAFGFRPNAAEHSVGACFYGNNAVNGRAMEQTQRTPVVRAATKYAIIIRVRQEGADDERAWR
ncbi:hypothetical protein PFISCL1PPCAC_3176, partial [Pristionchus fissidentatus]